MNKIPEDVIKAATDIAYSAECGVAVGSLPGAIYIARAILAERERCARLVENLTYAFEGNEVALEVNRNLRKAASEIRGQQ